MRPVDACKEQNKVEMLVFYNEHNSSRTCFLPHWQIFISTLHKQLRLQFSLAIHFNKKQTYSGTFTSKVHEGSKQSEGVQTQAKVSVKGTTIY